MLYVAEIESEDILQLFHSDLSLKNLAQSIRVEGHEKVQVDATV